MDYTYLCINCFSNKGDQDTCPFCDYEEEKSEASLFLTPRSTLANKYIVGRVLGQGGFGITYLGWDFNLAILIAIKEFFPQGLVSRAPGLNTVISYSGSIKDQFNFGVESFLGEARTLARFEQHPNIVTIRDFFKENNTAYMVMTFLQGLTLLQHLKHAGGKIPAEQAIQIISPVIDALKNVHDAGIMHRDISPDNIFITNEGRVILIDFGAARQKMHEKSKSLSVILKSGYAPEEQYRSRGKQGPWTDIYAIGATFYRCITGQTIPDSLDRMIDDILIPPSQLNDTIDPLLEAVLLKALAVKAENRYQSLEEMQTALTYASAKDDYKEFLPDKISRKLNEEEIKEYVDIDKKPVKDYDQVNVAYDSIKDKAENSKVSSNEYIVNNYYPNRESPSLDQSNAPAHEGPNNTLQYKLKIIFKYALILTLSTGVILVVLTFFQLLNYGADELLQRLMTIAKLAGQNLVVAILDNMLPVISNIMEKTMKLFT